MKRPRTAGTVSNQGRSNRYIHVEDETPRSQREKDDRFDMYRNDQPPVRRMPAPRIKNTAHEPRQLWYVACLICALGAFCLFADSVMVVIEGLPIRLTSVEVLFNSSYLTGDVAKPVVVMSALPIAFIGLSAAFAVMKEKSFEKASMVMIALPVIIIVLNIFLAEKIVKYNTPLIQIAPGFSFMIQIACSVGVIIVVICQRIICTIKANRSSW